MLRNLDACVCALDEIERTVLVDQRKREARFGRKGGAVRRQPHRKELVRRLLTVRQGKYRLSSSKWWELFTDHGRNADARMPCVSGPRMTLPVRVTVPGRPEDEFLTSREFLLLEEFVEQRRFGEYNRAAFLKFRDVALLLMASGIEKTRPGKTFDLSLDTVAESVVKGDWGRVCGRTKPGRRGS